MDLPPEYLLGDKENPGALVESALPELMKLRQEYCDEIFVE